MEKTTALVTGATSGIGFETAKALSKQNVRVIIGCRDVRKGENAVKEIINQYQDADVHLGPPLDLSKPESIRRFVKEYDYPLHVLVNNAGMNRQKSDHYVGTIPEIVQVNYLGPFLLNLLMEEKLIKHAGLSNVQSRVVNVSSITHRFSSLGKDVLDNEDVSGMFGNSEGDWYAATKLANVFFTSYMGTRWKKAGVNVHSVAVDPGGVVTGIWKNSKWENSWLLKLIFAPASDGAKPVVHAATTDFDKEKNIDSKHITEKTIRSAKKNPHPGKNVQEARFPDFRFYARGAFSWRTLTNVPDTPKWNGFLHATIDWPIRKLSGGIIASKTVPVQANLAAYSIEITEKLYKASAKFLGLPEGT